MTKNIIRSPLFYVGDKYKLMPQLIEYFPKQINNYYEPFVGGGTVFLNITANNYFLNDLDENLMRIHKYLIKSAENTGEFYQDIEKIILKYKLSYSYKKNDVSNELRKKYKKTYFAHYNKGNYIRLRNDFNKKKEKDFLLLYVLLIYGFNRMLRFNKKGEFNIPVGNVDFNKNVVDALNNYFECVRKKNIKIHIQDYIEFFKGRKYEEHDFVYIDPPYLITSSEYNKNWDLQNDLELLKIIDNLNQNGVRFALSNVTHYKGRENRNLMEWLKKYKSYTINSNYISYHNNNNKEIREVLITNY